MVGIAVLRFLFVFQALVIPAFSEIEAGQALKIEVEQVAEAEKKKIDGVYKVSRAGLVNLPFIGALQAAGLESEQLEKAIEGAYIAGDIFEKVKVRVGKPELKEEMLVHVGGQVMEPGPQPYVEGMTVMQAIQSAGGPTEFGAMNHVNLYREGKRRKIVLTMAEGRDFSTMPDDTIEVLQKGSIDK